MTIIVCGHGIVEADSVLKTECGITMWKNGTKVRGFVTDCETLADEATMEIASAVALGRNTCSIKIEERPAWQVSIHTFI